MKKLIASALLLLQASAYANKPTCHSSNGGYCSYTGEVARIYVNKSNLILMYFDTLMDVDEWEKAGLSARQTDATIVSLSDSPEFAKLFYSTALAAQASGRQVQIQMRGVKNGYLMVDRIWLAQ
ncbi:hypothetical protein [Pleionea sp. CnH1-48]|uniref:hypothetical protein n=1 Tax=Pleionea sp. CnH1-48 TaxID=2954494 RepID=UPI0020981EEE|nr:hypothetical protein [Pleionea sp. CnH1-48]MCO7224251.1 hypothetical protein [Pleionea sp. CnH1-48]